MTGHEMTSVEQQVKGCDPGHKSRQQVRQVRRPTHNKEPDLQEDCCRGSLRMGHQGGANFSKTLPTKKKLNSTWESSGAIASINNQLNSVVSVPSAKRLQITGGHSFTACNSYSQDGPSSTWENCCYREAPCGKHGAKTESCYSTGLWQPSTTSTKASSIIESRKISDKPYIDKTCCESRIANHQQQQDCSRNRLLDKRTAQPGGNYQSTRNCHALHEQEIPFLTGDIDRTEVPGRLR